MIILINRHTKNKKFTIGRMFVNGELFCDTLELPRQENGNGDRGYCIREGKYNITLKEQSPRFSKVAQYDKCKGFLPRLLNVPTREGILIHIGNTAKDTSGCILVGSNANTDKGIIYNSTKLFWELYAKMMKATTQGESIIITIV